MELDLLSLLGLILVIIVHTGALFYWGGRTSQTLRELRTIVKRQDTQLERVDERLRQLELRRHRPASEIASPGTP